MEKKLKIYVAGQDVFRANAVEYLRNLQKLGEQYGFEILTPFDTDTSACTNKEELPYWIGDGNFETIDKSDIIVANLNSFRGVCVDDGTSVEIGYGYKAGKMICGYCSDPTTLKQKVLNNLFNEATWMDFPVIEDFDLRFNLMIHTAIKNSGGVIGSSFEDVIQQLSKKEFRACPFPPNY
jgi:nucleoside 2-deoxyribosyltransferase